MSDLKAILKNNADLSSKEREIEIPHLLDEDGNPVRQMIRRLTAAKRLEVMSYMTDAQTGKYNPAGLGLAMTWATVYGLKGFTADDFDIVNSDPELVQTVGKAVFDFSGLNQKEDSKKKK